MKTMSRLILGFVFIAAAAAPARAGASSDTLRPEVVETFFRLRVVAAALDSANVNGPVPGPTTGLIPFASVLDRSSVMAKLLRGSLRDAWGRPILFWSNGSDYLVASLGADGRPQFDYALDPPYSGVPRGWAGTDPDDDLLIANGLAYRGPSSQSELVRRAMAEIRSAGTACESFAVDNNNYPGPVAPIDALSSIETDLSPIYIRVLPILDPWGHPYRFWSNTRAYALLSYGVDGQPDYPYAAWGQVEFEALAVGATTLIGPDVVFGNGQFRQWPGIGINP
jgi:hypothetical protein